MKALCCVIVLLVTACIGTDVGNPSTVDDVGTADMSADASSDGMEDSGTSADLVESDAAADAAMDLASPDAGVDSGDDTGADLAEDSITDQAGGDAALEDSVQDSTTGDTDVDTDLPGPDVEVGIDLGDVSCPSEDTLWGDVELSVFLQIPALSSLDISGVYPDPAPVYWELRYVFGGEDPVIISSTGVKCSDSADYDTCVATFDGLESSSGFADVCPDVECYYYVAINSGDDSSLITSAEDFVAFLGLIQNPNEAIMVAMASGLSWSGDDKSVGAVRTVEDGFDLILRRMVEFCAPIVVERVFAHVDQDGTLEVTRAQNYSVDCGGCI